LASALADAVLENAPMMLGDTETEDDQYIDQKFECGGHDVLLVWRAPASCSALPLFRLILYTTIPHPVKDVFEIIKINVIITLFPLALSSNG
jgi:hypothetical protein